MPFRCIKKREASHRELLIIEPKEKEKKAGCLSCFFNRKKGGEKEASSQSVYNQSNA